LKDHFAVKSILLCLTLAVFASAVSADPKADDVELTITAVGRIAIDPEGKVHDYTMETNLAPTIANQINRHVRSWRFEPILVDGRAVIAETGLRLSLAAVPDGEHYKFRIERVDFGAAGESSRITMPRRGPRYPNQAIQALMEARVILIVRVDEHGKAIDVHRYQTSLSPHAKGAEAARWRRIFEHASTNAVKHWTFEPGELVDGRPIGGSVMVPIEFRLTDAGSARGDGQWRAYVPGPIQPAPWLSEAIVADDVGALGNGETLALSSRFRLKDDVVGTTL
jgi:hypothetical protein